MIPTLTPETAAVERTRILADVRWHRNAAAQRLRDLERLEADCRQVGIRLIREPVVRAQGAETHAGADPHTR